MYTYMYRYMYMYGSLKGAKCLVIWLVIWLPWESHSKSMYRAVPISPHPLPPWVDNISMAPCSWILLYCKPNNCTIRYPTLLIRSKRCINGLHTLYTVIFGPKSVQIRSSSFPHAFLNRYTFGPHSFKNKFTVHYEWHRMKERMQRMSNAWGPNGDPMRTEWGPFASRF